MIKKLFNTIVVTALFAFLKAQQPVDKIFHYSSMDAMRNGVYTGDLTVQDLKKKGDFGLGTYNLLDGELIALDGNVYRIASDGSVEIADNKRLVPFGSFTFFKKDHLITLENIQTTDMLMKKLLEVLPSSNRFYAVKIETTFMNVTLGGAEKVHEKDTTGIAVLMKTRPLYKKQNIKGTLTGFYNPSYIGGLDLSPFHFHFLSEDKRVGGHLMEGTFDSAKITVQLDEKNAYELILPGKSNDGYRRQWKSSEPSAQY
ncbi:MULTISPECIES: acetolactate decarboxylase [Chryseobacterium]|uniref:Alpha-acetolactate decarboxylase n=1 Tax=Chryseobacterium candidae TaxID=1978493 RepID=A0ABY2RA85_9FLAO|nr:MULTISPECIES: acetolactate decarboxylase [Chryseobacterium]THV62507.1 acetolactate decarboxylase [Chryseobacterium candidae]